MPARSTVSGTQSLSVAATPAAIAVSVATETASRTGAGAREASMDAREEIVFIFFLFFLIVGVA